MVEAKLELEIDTEAMSSIIVLAREKLDKREDLDDVLDFVKKKLPYALILNGKKLCDCD